MNDTENNLNYEDEKLNGFENGFFISLDDEKHINGMYIVFSQVELEDYRKRELIEISQKDYESVGPNSFYIDGMIVEGVPAELSNSDNVKREIFIRYRNKAKDTISTLQNAVELNMATENEIERLREWKIYDVLLSRIDLSQELISWPTQPID